MDAQDPFEPQRVDPEVPDPEDRSAELPQHDGRPVIGSTPLLRLELQRAQFEPLAGMARCAYWMQVCLLSGEGNVDDCAFSAPVCAADPTWMQEAPCCPAACFERYREAREQGVSRFAAFMRTYHTELQCFPAVREQLGR